MEIRISSFIESEDDIDNEFNEVNFIRIPWEGSAPKIVIDKSQKHVIKSPFDDDDDEMKCVRKIYFCRDMNDPKRRTLKVWRLPLTWDNDNIRSAFNIFGDIETVALKNQNNIMNRHCLIRLKHSSKVDFAMNYDSSLIIQPVIKGAVHLGINKYLINYIKTRPHNINQLQYEVNKFMAAFDKLKREQKEKQRQKPRRNRGWIQKRDKDGFTKIHYPNPWQRKKNKAYRIVSDMNKNSNNDNFDGYGRPIGDGKINEINPNDTFNAPPEKQVYDRKRKESYYKMNQIKDIYAKRKRKLFQKQSKAKQRIKKQMRGQYSKQSKERISIAGVRLRDSIKKQQRWNKDMIQTTNLRKNRKFKPN